VQPPRQVRRGGGVFNTAAGISMLSLLVLNLGVVTQAIHKELYTTNAICRRKYCINPIFPGLEDLHRLDKAKWVCATLQKSVPSMEFCKGAINYNPAFPSPADGGTSLAQLVRKQEQAAITMYAYHLSGMGVEYWDHTRPDLDDDDCIKSVWRMACYTYFPKSGVGCKEGEETKYLRPCQSSCFNYIRACGVECCDESVQCIFEHTKTLNSKEKIKTSGYAEHDGPSSMCTGAAHRSGTQSLWIVVLCILCSLLSQTEGATINGDNFPVNARKAPTILRYACIVIIVAVAFLLQGCDGGQPHKVGNWRAEQDYLINYEFVPPGSDAGDAKLNSCSIGNIAQTLQCSGRGICKAWDPEDLANPLMLCECDRNWADPECRTPRKSQIYAYSLSLLTGFLGLDQFYLGFPGNGVAKLCTFGGFGLWWIVDICRIGSAPVYAHDFRVANDLPHWAFVVSSVTTFFMLGFILVLYQTAVYRKGKRKDALVLMQEEEAQGAGDIPLPISKLRQQGKWHWQHQHEVQDMHRSGRR